MNEHLNFWKTALIKGFVMAGVTFFSVIVTMDFNTAVEPSFIAMGTYVFAEAFKYYNLQEAKKVNNKTYTFLI